MRAWRSLRRRILTPDVAQTQLDVRGFHIKNAESRHRLETVGESFLKGFAVAAEAADASSVEASLGAVDRPYRGFAYEGAAMAFAIRDAVPVGRRRHVAQLLAGAGDQHVYMAYVGVGWAMARLPRVCWGGLHAPDPLLRWLVLDGYGFHQAYFKTDRYVFRREREERFAWPKGTGATYPLRVIDQGIGRAAWFVAGTDPDVVVRLLAQFPAGRQADLFAGAGLAATYAGGATEAELVRFREAAGVHAKEVAQGAAFAAGARVRAGLVVPHNELATQVFCRLSVEEAAKVTDDMRVDLPPDRPEWPAYEEWRHRVKHALTRMTGVTKAERL
jgi:hypothetical protein